MADPEHLERLEQGVTVWNQWREKNPDIQPNLSEVDFFMADLRCAYFAGADLRGAYLIGADLRGANLSGADLGKAILGEANLFEDSDEKCLVIGEDPLIEVNLSGTDFGKVILGELSEIHFMEEFSEVIRRGEGKVLVGENLFSDEELSDEALIQAIRGGVNVSVASLIGERVPGANLSGADLSGAFLEEAQLIDTDFTDANLRDSILNDANLNGARLNRAGLSGADLIEAILTQADFREADLRKARLISALLVKAKLCGADLREADLEGANIVDGDLREADLREANLSYANLGGADLSGAILSMANLTGADLYLANLCRAELSEADITRARLVETNLKKANLTSCLVYGISAWKVKLEETAQSNLIITPPNDPTIMVDHLEVAQFIYLLLNNEKIRDVIDTVANRAVLILGRFTPERKAVLGALRKELRKKGYVPILFDFDKPSSRNLTETVSTIAHIARFVIADITDAKSIPQELQRVVPGLPSLPVQPLILNSQYEYAMFRDLLDYQWVLKPYRYKDLEELLASLEENVIAPAIDKAQEIEDRRKAIEKEMTR